MTTTFVQIISTTSSAENDVTSTTSSSGSVLDGTMTTMIMTVLDEKRYTQATNDGSTNRDDNGYKTVLDDTMMTTP